MQHWVSFLRNARAALIGLTLAIMLAAIGSLPHLKVETDFLNFLPSSDADLAFFKETGEVFGGNYSAMVALECDDVFSTDVLNKLQALTKAYAELDGVAMVMSLSNIIDIDKTSDGIAITKLIGDSIPQDQAAMQRLKAKVLGNEMYTSTFVSKDAHSAAIVIRLAQDANEEVLAGEIYSRTAAIWGDDNAYFAGFPMVMEHLLRTLFSDMFLLTALVAVAILGVLYLSFHALLGVLLPLLTVVMSTLVAFAAMALFGAPITLISSVLPVVLFSTGTAYTIHLLNAVAMQEAKEAKEAGEGKTSSKENKDKRWYSIGSAMSSVGTAIVLSGLTTVFGFLALMSSPLTLFVDFGLYAAIGVAAALAFSLLFVPIMLSFFKPRTKAHSSSRVDKLFDAAFAQLAHFVTLHPGKIVVVASVLVAIGSLGMTRLSTDMNVFSFIGENSRPKLAEEYMRREFGGTMPIAVHVDAQVDSPLVLRELLRAGRFLRVIDDVSQVSSIADLIAEMNAKLNGTRDIPKTTQGVASLWLLLEGNEVLSQLVTENRKRAMLQARLDDKNRLQRNEIVAAIDEVLEHKVRSQLVELSADTLTSSARARFDSLVTDEIVEQVELQLRYRGFHFNDVESVREQLLLARHQQPTPLPSTQQQQILTAFLQADDCDIDVTDAPLRAQLSAALAAHALTTTAEIEQRVTSIAPGLAAADAEGVRLFAIALLRRLQQANARNRVENLMDLLHSTVTPTDVNWPESLLEETRATLSGVLDVTWPVSPKTYAELLGRVAPKQKIVDVTLKQTGLPYMQRKLDQQLVRSQIISLGVALITVFVLLIVQLRSLLGALISIVPIVFTLLLNFGGMGFANISVNPGTMLIAALAIGIGIDYTIHVVTRLKQELQAGQDQASALQRTLQTSGRAVIINVASVALGFLVLMASQLVIVKQFGVLIALSMILCAIGALTLIPALLLITKAQFVQKRHLPPN